MAGPEPSLGQLRPALQLGLEVARTADSRSLPGRVRALVRARRLPASWAVTMLQVLDEDAAFRSRVAADPRAAELEPIPQLWLNRPEGWSDQVGRLVEAANESEEQEKGTRLEHERFLAMEEELAETRAELSRQRALNAELASGAADARRSLERRVERAESAAAELEAVLAERDAALAAAGAEGARLLAQVDSLRTELDRLRTEQATTERRAEALRAERDAADAARQGLDRSIAELRTSLGRHVERAADAAAELGRALAGAAGYLTPGAGASPPGVDDPDRARTGGVPRPTRRSIFSEPARRPVELPPAVFEDSPEAAVHLVRAPGSHLVVDGYNVAFTSWPGIPDLPGVRQRLVSALSELAVRVHRPVTVVFDGAEEGNRMAAPAAARQWLTIIFSESGVEADEVILHTVAELPADVPVVVATNDKQVRGDARRLGANVISVEQLLTVLGRHPLR